MVKGSREWFIEELLSGSRIEIYDGPRPENSDDKPTGDLLAYWDNKRLHMECDLSVLGKCEAEA